MTSTSRQRANLRPLNTLDTETARDIRSRGGKASAQARRNKVALLKRLSDIVYTPLKPSEPLTDINDLLDGKIENTNLLDLQTITDNGNFTVYDILLLELIRQSTVGRNYKALTYTLDLLREYDNNDGLVQLLIMKNQEYRDGVVFNSDKEWARETIEEYREMFEQLNPELSYFEDIDDMDSEEMRKLATMIYEKSNYQGDIKEHLDGMTDDKIRLILKNFVKKHLETFIEIDKRRGLA